MNYYDRPELSCSAVKRFIRCEADAMEGGDFPSTQAMLVGSYVDASLLEPEILPAFLEENHEAMHRKGGKTRLAAFAESDVMIARCREDAVFMDMLKGDAQAELYGEIGGVPFKGKLDVLNHDKRRIVDLKTTRHSTQTSWSNEHRCHVPFYESWNYWMQLAVYQELVHQATGVVYDVFIAVVDKQTPPDLSVLAFDDQDRLWGEVDSVVNVVKRIQKLKSGEEEPLRCGKCSHCRRTKKVEVVSAVNYKEMF